LTPIVNVVHSTTKSYLPKDVQAPGLLWSFCSILHKIHRVWRWYKKAEIYNFEKNPNNFYSLLAGHILNLTSNSLVRVAAQCVLIASNILKCVSKTVAVAKAYHKWVYSFTGNTPLKRSAKKTESIYDEKTQDDFTIFMQTVGERIKRIAIATFNLFKAMFKLSMTFMDAHESFCLNPEKIRSDTVIEVFINGADFIDNMVKNQQRLLDCMETHERLIKRILTGIGSRNVTYDSLKDTVEKTLSATSTVQKVANAGGGVAKNILQHGVWGAAAIVGLEKHLPKSLIPDENPDFLEPKKTTKSTQPGPVSNATKKRIQMLKEQAVYVN